jgi:hypothetical protein
MYVARAKGEVAIVGERTKEHQHMSLTKAWSILSTVRGLTVTVATYSMGTSLQTLCHLLSCLTMQVCQVPAYKGGEKRVKSQFRLH